MGGAVVEGDIDARIPGHLHRVYGTLGLPDLGPGFAIEHVGAGHALLPGAHEGQFDLILDVFDVHRAAGGHAALEGARDLAGEIGDQFADAGAGGGIAALHGEEGLRNGHGDFAFVVADHRAIALDGAQLPWRHGVERRALGSGARSCPQSSSGRSGGAVSGLRFSLHDAFAPKKFIVVRLARIRAETNINILCLAFCPRPSSWGRPSLVP